MLSQLTLLVFVFFVFLVSSLFMIVQTAAFPALIMWTTLLHCVERISCVSREKLGHMGGRGLGALFFFFLSLSYKAVLLSLWVWFATSRGRHFTADGWFPCGACTCISSAPQEEFKSGLDSQLLTASGWWSWISFISPSVWYLLLYFKHWKLDTSVITPAEGTHPTRPTPPYPVPHRAGPPTSPPPISSMLLFVLSLFKNSVFFLTWKKKRKKISLVDFVLWLAISKVQS